MSASVPNETWQLSLPFMHLINVLRTISINSINQLGNQFNKNIGKSLNQRDHEQINQEFSNYDNQLQILSKTTCDFAELIKQNTSILMLKHKACTELIKKSKQYRIKPAPINDSAKQMLECLIFGYVRELIEDKYDMMIPYHLKMICFEFYGNIIMDTNILNINQLNTFGYVLKSSLHQKKCKYFYTQKIYDSKKDGFDSTSVDAKCGALNYHSIGIIKTNQNHIMAYFHPSWSECNDYLQCGKNNGDPMIGCLLNSAISTIPMLYENFAPTYHFSNDFKADFNEKLSEIATKYDPDNIYPIECIEDINDKICISEFAIFTVQ